MLPELVWTRGAEVDLQAIYEDIEEFHPGGGDRLLMLLDASLYLLRQFPEMAPFFDPPIRRLLLSSKRHGLFYSWEKRGIVLHALADLRNDPNLLKERFRKIREAGK